MQTFDRLFAMSFYLENQKVAFLERVEDIKQAASQLTQQGLQWTHANVYYEKKAEFVGRYFPEKSVV